MKKIILMAGLMLTAAAQAQVEVTINGAPVANNQVYTFNVLNGAAGEHNAELAIVVTNNNPDESINLKLRMDAVENNEEGGQVQFCFGELCYFSVEEGSMVPSQATGLTLEPYETNGPNEHFFNNWPGDVAGMPVSYTMSLVELDEAGTVIEPPLLTFGYVYDSTAGIDDIAGLQNIGISVKNTLVKTQMDLDAAQNATLEVYGTNGQLVKTAAIATGAQSVDLSALSAGVYIARFTTEANKTSQIRIVKN